MSSVQLHRVDSDSSNIYKLEEGQHILGRGPLLDCTSKKVSRNHAILQITENTGVLLISTHTNPCFYQAGDTSHLTLIKNGMSHILHDGDKFALLPDEYWYKIKIKEQSGNVGNTSSNNQTAVDNNSVNNNSKRSLCDNESVPGSIKKKTRTSDSVQEIVKTLDDDIELLMNLKNTRNFPENIADKCNVDNSLNLDDETIVKEETSTIEDSREGNIINECNSPEFGTPSPDFLSAEYNFDFSDSNETPSVSNVDKKNNELGQNQQLEQETIEPDKESIKAVKQIEDKHLNTSTNQVNLNISNNDVEATGEDDKDVERSSKPDIKLELDNEVEGNDDPTQEIKEENYKKPDEQESDVDVKYKKENVDKKPDDDTTKPSTSGNSTARRIRCWYGSSCYRKNMVHKNEFSHPGDDDYDSDPNDQRPICSYGADCYRRNTAHRKMYRHPGQGKGTRKPTKPKKPSSERKRQVRPKTKKVQESESEDSYDYSDPFLYDGSSDDFEPSGMSDSDYEESNSDQGEDESQETTNRLKKEARKFTKGRKKD